MRISPLVLISCLIVPLAVNGADDWSPADSTLSTPWTKDVSPENAHPEYPRPQMVRESWINLNGLWQYGIVDRQAPQPDRWDGQILVPYPVQSALSGVKRPVSSAQQLWYRRTFAVPSWAEGKRLLLHFQAVDWHARVSLNGQSIGEHKGGYDPFTMDVTDAIDTTARQQELVVSVWDPTDQGPQPRGKQVTEPKGIWYTAVTGIWQTVWLEAVPKTAIRGLKMIPDIDAGRLCLTVEATSDARVEAVAIAGDRQVASATGAAGTELTLAIDDAKLWSPDSPFLYDLRVRLLDGDRVQDEVNSYFGMRKIEVRPDEAGVNRLCLNNQPLFQIGPLDQGWWPDGLYTAATDEALRFDVVTTRRLGFNMARKHVKVEPDRWYYHCDRAGLLVWQDMPSGGGPGDPVGDGTSFPRSQFELELKRMIDAFHNHPCIVMWVPFNEGWGQHDTETIAQSVQQYDPTRPVNEASGWTDKGSGDVKDIHSYPGPRMPDLEEDRVAVLGEFGGLGLPVAGHLWWNKRNWGYRNYTDTEGLQAAYDELMRKLWPMIGRGLAAAVYTQTSDVEGEVNGLMTYDRKVVKFDVERMAELHARLFQPPPIIITRVVVPTSEAQPQTWRFTTDEPAKSWEQTDFDDRDWQQGPGGFGTEGTPGSVVRTIWRTSDIWLRRQVELKSEDFANLYLRIHHDEDAQVYFNGNLVAKRVGYESEYVDLPLNRKALASLTAGKNTLAVHCQQTKGGQYIDVGLVEIIEKPRESE